MKFPALYRTFLIVRRSFPANLARWLPTFAVGAVWILAGAILGKPVKHNTLSHVGLSGSVAPPDPGSRDEARWKQTLGYWASSFARLTRSIYFVISQTRFRSIWSGRVSMLRKSG